MRPFADYVGRVFGRITVLAKAPTPKYTPSKWLCRCQCGTEWVAWSTALLAGKTTSCGCRAREVTAIRVATHGEARPGAHTPEYRAWRDMKKRCLQPSYVNWKDYGGRGITICEKWRNSYETFIADMGRKPSPEHSLDRIDVNGNYGPGNCRWATPVEQRRNRRDWDPLDYMRICAKCGKHFKKRPDSLGKFCSQRCYYAAGGRWNQLA